VVATGWTWFVAHATQPASVTGLRYFASAAFWRESKVSPRWAPHPLRSRPTWAACRLDGWGHIMRSQVVETVLVTFLFAAAAVGVYLGAVGVVAILS